MQVNSDINKFKVGNSSKINWKLDKKYEWTKMNTSWIPAAQSWILQNGPIPSMVINA